MTDAPQGLFRSLSGAIGGAVQSVGGAVTGAVSTVTGSATSPAKPSPRPRPTTNLDEPPPPPEDPYSKTFGEASKYYGAVAAWTEKNLGPHVTKMTDQLGEEGSGAVKQLHAEGLLTQEAMEEAYRASKTQVLSTDGTFVGDTIIGDVPYIDKIPYASICGPGADIKIGPAPSAPAFVLWNAICLCIGFFDMSLFALIHFAGDASHPLLYLPMYAMKLAFDLAVCSITSYALYFIFIKSKSKFAMQFGMLFILAVVIKSFVVGWYTFGLLQYLAGLANTMLLLRAFIVYSNAPASTSSAAASLVAEASGYAELKDEEDAVVVDMPDKKIDVNPSASLPTVEKVYSPVTYP